MSAHFGSSNPSTRPTGETDRHRSLKALTTLWARANGLACVAKEVSFPHNRFRVDVAAYRPNFKVPSKVRLGDDLGITAVFECKQARSDLLKDSKNKEQVLARLQELNERKAKLEALLKMHYPNLAKGEALFPEFDCYDFNSAGHQSHARVLKKIQEAQSAAAYKTKFDRLLRYRLAHLHYLVTEKGIIKPHEVPLGWGLLVREEDGLRLVQAPALQQTSAPTQIIFLQRVAAAASRSMES
jgi:hypothetical protein